MTTPSTHVTEGDKLDPQALVHLYELQLNPSGVLYMSKDTEITWQGNLYQNLPIKVSGTKISASGQIPRPTLTISNPSGIYSKSVGDGLLDRAVLIERKVLRSDLEADLPVWDERRWYLSRLISDTALSISYQLRGLTDRQTGVMPIRMYIQPEFSSVRLR